MQGQKLALNLVVFGAVGRKVLGIADALGVLLYFIHTHFIILGYIQVRGIRVNDLLSVLEVPCLIKFKFSISK